MTAEWWYEPTRDLLWLLLGVWLVSKLAAIGDAIRESRRTTEALRQAIESIQISWNIPTTSGQRCHFRESAITDALGQHGRRERARELSLQLARERPEPNEGS